MYKGRLVTGCRVVAMGAALQVLLTDLHARPQCVWVQYYSDRDGLPSVQQLK